VNAVLMSHGRGTTLNRGAGASGGISSRVWSGEGIRCHRNEPNLAVAPGISSSRSRAVHRDSTSSCPFVGMTLLITTEAVTRDRQPRLHRLLTPGSPELTPQSTPASMMRRTCAGRPVGGFSGGSSGAMRAHFASVRSRLGSLRTWTVGHHVHRWCLCLCGCDVVGSAAEVTAPHGGVPRLRQPLPLHFLSSASHLASWCRRSAESVPIRFLSSLGIS